MADPLNDMVPEEEGFLFRDQLFRTRSNAGISTLFTLHSFVSNGLEHWRKYCIPDGYRVQQVPYDKVLEKRERDVMARPQLPTTTTTERNNCQLLANSRRCSTKPAAKFCLHAVDESKLKSWQLSHNQLRFLRGTAIYYSDSGRVEGRSSGMHDFDVGHSLSASTRIFLLLRFLDAVVLP